MSASKFENRKLVIATKHKKENVIAPILNNSLGVNCFTIENFDTDILGTFSGEIERKLDPISTVRKKCLLAMKESNCDLGVASEGSFGPHSSVFFTCVDEEILIFIDKKNNLEIIAKEISTTTNFNTKVVETEEELLEFATSVKFPTHGLILRKSAGDNIHLTKGIQDLALLKQEFKKLRKESNSVLVETDMRAMNNPTRMSVIEIATQKLVSKIGSCCPECQTPGFDITDVNKGLKCKYCGLPTKSVLNYLLKCQHCEYTKEEMYPHKKTSEDPMYCDFCNP